MSNMYMNLREYNSNHSFVIILKNLQNILTEKYIHMISTSIRCAFTSVAFIFIHVITAFLLTRANLNLEMAILLAVSITIDGLLFTVNGFLLKEFELQKTKVEIRAINSISSDPKFDILNVNSEDLFRRIEDVKMIEGKLDYISKLLRSLFVLIIIIGILFLFGIFLFNIIF